MLSSALIVLASARYSEPAPSWIPIVAFAVPVLIVLAVLIPALRGRKRHKKGRSSQERGVQASTVAIGSARTISDGGDYSVEALQRALSFAEEDWGPKNGEPHNEGAGGEALGLKTKIDTSTEVLNPNLMWGEREQGQVFIRVGPDEKIEGGTELYSNRHIRQITTLRVATPEFLMADRDGRPTIVDGSAPEIEVTLQRIKQNEEIWEGFACKGGPDGIVCSRPVHTQPGFWVYDLWLLETIAREAKLPALDEARIGPAWKIPYGLGRESIDF